MSPKIQIKIVQHAAKDDLLSLYLEAGWYDPASGEDDGFLDRIVPNSAIFVGAFDQKKMIGMGRALSDMASDAYIQDIVVLKAYRKQGLGKKIVQMLVKKLKKAGVDWIGLVAQPGTTKFYKSIGFQPLKGHTALKYEDK